MNKEFHVIDVGFIGSFIEERADNDGDTLRKNISLNVPDNNIYVINPVTGLLESNVGNVNTDNPQFVQFNSDKPSAPSTNLIIKNIGKTIKVVNTTNTEICVRETISGSNYVYGSGSLPKGAENCLKSIYFTSNKGIHWPKLDQTYAVLDDLSSKIPYDEGISKKHYKIHPLTEDHLKMVEKETKISYEFLKKLHPLFLFDSEFPDNIQNSKIKLSPEWDGFSVDKNNPNNLVYSDYFKTGSADYANFVFLVNDRTLDNLHEYFLSGSIQKQSYFGTTTTYNPETWMDKKYERKEEYGNLISLKVMNLTTDAIENREQMATEEQILDIIYKRELYKMNPEVTDLGLVEEIVATNIFMDIIQDSDLFVVNKIEIDAADTTVLQEIESIQTNINVMIPLIEKYSELIPKNKMVINNKVFSLIKTYFNFQRNNRFPARKNIFPLKDKFGTLFNQEPFQVTNEFGLPFFPENLSREFILTENSETNEITVTTASFTVDTAGNENIQLNINDIVEVVQNSTPIHKRLDMNTDYAQSKTVFLTKPIFDNGTDREKNFYTSSAPLSHVNYYLPVYTNNPNNPLSKYIFDIAYAHISGSGSTYINNNTEYLPSKTLYKQYLAECFGNQDYMIFDKKRSDHFYVLQFNRNAFKDRLDSQNMQITFAPIISNSNQLINTGSNFYADENSSVIYKLIDDSKTMKVYSASMFGVEEYYNLVEGTQQDGLKYEQENSECWGMVFPRRGLIFLDAQVMDKYCNFNTVTASINGDNMNKMFISISSSCAPNSVRNTHEYWYVRSAEQYSDENYFCRVGQNEFNYTNNYTYNSGSTRKIFYDKLNNTTKTYISTIGLYDDDKNLIAVGKLTKPLLKDSSKEYIFNVRIKSN